MFLLGLVIGIVVGGLGSTLAILLCSFGAACDSEHVQKHDDKNSEN